LEKISNYHLREKEKRLKRYIEQAKETVPEGRARDEMFPDLVHKERELHEILNELQSRKFVSE